MNTEKSSMFYKKIHLVKTKAHTTTVKNIRNIASTQHYKYSQMLIQSTQMTKITVKEQEIFRLNVNYYQIFRFLLSFE